MSFVVSSSHGEGGEREYAVLTKRLEGEGGRVKALHGVRIEFDRDSLGRPLFPSQREIPGSEFSLPADLVLLAMGFVHPVREGLIRSLGVDLDSRGGVRADTKRFETSEPGVFAAGDVRRGQSLVVWAQWEGREAARAVDAYLMGSSRLQSRDAHV
jgi:glutamate synthase (NADPH/NADH) small chain